MSCLSKSKNRFTLNRLYDSKLQFTNIIISEDITVVLLLAKFLVEASKLRDLQPSARLDWP